MARAPDGGGATKKGGGGHPDRNGSQISAGGGRTTEERRRGTDQVVEVERERQIRMEKLEELSAQRGNSAMEEQARTMERKEALCKAEQLRQEKVQHTSQLTEVE